ncbi:MAG: T9SS type A sorting domain-containing protein [Candidatus Caldipriscus sp.]|nr:T9SS type A sorting domain-containing protein [Candidatus Caldipriscus sp.]
MLIILIGTAGLGDIYEKVVALKAEVKSTNTCDMDKSFETLAEYINEAVKRMDEVTSTNNTALISAYASENAEYLRKIGYEAVEISDILLSRCRPWYRLLKPFYLYGIGNPEYGTEAVCQCPGGTCSGLICGCTKEGCWAIFSKNNGNFEIGTSTNTSRDANVVVYDVLGRVVYRGDYKNVRGLKKGVYYVKSTDGSYKKLIVK